MKGHQMLAKLQKDQENEEGFTLIELLVVVIIIGILAAIAIPAFLNQRERAWQSELTSTVRNVALDVEAEATKYGGDYAKVTFPTTAAPTQATFDAFVDDALDGVQDSTTTPVDYKIGTRSTNSFAICMEHNQLVDGSTVIGSVTYASARGGIQPFVSGPCPTTAASL